MEIIPVRALRDNYIWMIVDAVSRSIWAVDPGEAQPVLDFIHQQNGQLKGILVTHHHADHTAGIPGLLRNYPSVQVYGAENSPLAYLTNRLIDGMMLPGALSGFSAMTIPGHTLDHLAYCGMGAVFCGDTLFSAGCGRVFEGTTQMMYASLMKLASLSNTVHIYCGHEYTADNLLFAATVDPANKIIHEKIRKITAMVKAGNSCTLPSTLNEEKSINPFLRCDAHAVIRAAEKHIGEKSTGPADVFRILRAWKNQFISH